MGRVLNGPGRKQIGKEILNAIQGGIQLKIDVEQFKGYSKGMLNGTDSVSFSFRHSQIVNMDR